MHNIFLLFKNTQSQQWVVPFLGLHTFIYNILYCKNYICKHWLSIYKSVNSIEVIITLFMALCLIAFIYYYNCYSIIVFVRPLIYNILFFISILLIWLFFFFEIREKELLDSVLNNILKNVMRNTICVILLFCIVSMYTVYVSNINLYDLFIENISLTVIIELLINILGGFLKMAPSYFDKWLRVAYSNSDYGLMPPSEFLGRDTYHGTWQHMYGSNNEYQRTLYRDQYLLLWNNYGLSYKYADRILVLARDNMITPMQVARVVSGNDLLDAMIERPKLSEGIVIITGSLNPILGNTTVNFHHNHYYIYDLAAECSKLMYAPRRIIMTYNSMDYTLSDFQYNISYGQVKPYISSQTKSLIGIVARHYPSTFNNLPVNATATGYELDDSAIIVSPTLGWLLFNRMLNDSAIGNIKV